MIKKGALSLLLRYSISCLRERGVETERIAEKVRKGEIGKEELPLLSKIPWALSGILRAKKKIGSKHIDEKVVEHYFLEMHDEDVKKWARKGKIKKAWLCLALPAKVVEVEGRRVLVETPFGKTHVKNEFSEALAEGDWVIVHRGVVVRKGTEEECKELWKKKEASL